MAQDFPNNPTLGQVFGSYVWNGTAWTGIGSANNLGVQVGQLRTASPIAVASQAERDAQYPTPAQGMSVYRTDLGVTQRYYGLFNSSTNPGGRSVAGWYNTEKSVGLVPVSPSSVVIATGTGTYSALGVVSFAGATAVSLNSIFTSQFDNYRVVIDITSSSALAEALFFRFRKSGTDYTATNYSRQGSFWNATTVTNYSNLAMTYAECAGAMTTGKTFGTVDVFSPLTKPGYISRIQSVTTVNNYLSDFSGILSASDTYDGFSIIPAAGTITGKVQVFGYND